VVKRQLGSAFAGSRSPVVQYYAIRALLPDCEVVLSALAHLSSTQPSDVVKAFAAGAPYLRVDGIIHEQEAELLRAIADTLECPIPPFVEVTPET